MKQIWTNAHRSVLALAAIIAATGCEADADRVPVPEPITQAELVTVVYHDVCPGCIDASFFGGTRQDHDEFLETFICGHREAGTAFGVERRLAAVEALPIETCAVIDNALLTTSPSVHCLDMGTVRLEAEWPSWDFPPAAFSDAVGGYPATLSLFGSDRKYVPSVPFSLIATGGADIAAFSVADTSTEPLRLTSPTATPDGGFPEVASDSPLSVTWEGGDPVASIALTLTGMWESRGEEMTLGCHVQNDGLFVVPAAALDSLTWGQATNLTLTAKRSVPVDVPELDGARWLLASDSSLIVHYDLSVTQPPPTKTMSDGYVGRPCSADAECGGGTCARSFYFPGGYCTLLNCTDDAQCPKDAVCNPAPIAAPVTAFCAAHCSSDVQCRTAEEYVCQGSASHQGCMLGIN